MKDLSFGWWLISADSLCKEVSISINTLSRSAGAFRFEMLSMVWGREERFEKITRRRWSREF